MTDDARATEKKQRLLQALDRGITQIHLDARRPGVLVPEQYRGNHHLALNLSYRYEPPDLTVTDWGIRETLSFSGRRFTVGVPWSAVYAVLSVVTQEVFMFAEDMPEELMEGATERIGRADLHPAKAPPAEPAPRRAVLREVVPEEGQGEEPKEGERPREATPPRRGHLRVVK